MRTTFRAATASFLLILIATLSFAFLSTGCDGRQPEITCVTAFDCPDGQTCVEGVCIDPSTLTDTAGTSDTGNGTADQTEGTEDADGADTISENEESGDDGGIDDIASDEPVEPQDDVVEPVDDTEIDDESAEQDDTSITTDELYDDVIADDMIPDDMISDDVLPDDMIPDEALPDDVLPDDVLPDDMLADEGTDDDMAVDDIVPDNDTSCDDQIDCTEDLFDGGVCSHRPKHDTCSLGDLCAAEEDCRPADGWLCRSCPNGKSDCVVASDICAPILGGPVCLPACKDDDDCPAGFTCGDIYDNNDILLGRGCSPSNFICCADLDGDTAGIGAECQMHDCDESRIDINPLAAEVCNGRDDDCSGAADDGLTAPASIHSLGVCAGLTQECHGAAGWVEPDLNSLPGYSPLDPPDESFTDANCDGIDGETAKAIFVDAVSGNDLNPGTREAPVQTVQQGIDLASVAGKEYVLVSAGNYDEAVTLMSGVSLYGGYDAANNWSRSAANTVRIYGGNPAVIGSGVHDIVLARLTIQSTDATGAGNSSYGLLLVSSQTVTVISSTLTAGRGVDGANGAGGATGGGGSNGGGGIPGCEDSGGFCSSCDKPAPGGGGDSPCGRNGGRGGWPGHDGGTGEIGTDGNYQDNGGAGGSWGDGSSCAAGRIEGYPANGGDGSSGSSGSHGAGGGSFGSLSGAFYLSANGSSGTGGTDGNGGGGGGGGRGGSNNCDSYGSSGGGGGGGGCGGGAGLGGSGGGGSFGLFLYQSDDIVVTGSTIETSYPGRGGNGGNGASGGAGGTGGNGGAYGGDGEQDDAGCGGWGGNGGAGGDGGHGGGGGGGPSIGILSVGSTHTETLTDFDLAPAGQGGSGAVNPGQNGLSADTHEL